MRDRIVALETAEVAAFSDLYQAADSGLVAGAGLSTSPVGDGVLLAASRVDVLALNRIVGFGLTMVPSTSAIDDAIRAIEASGCPRCFVQVAPVEGHEALVSHLEERGLRHYNNWMRLVRDLSEPGELSSDSGEIDVRQVGGADAAVFGEIVATAFGYPPSIAPLVGQAVGRRHWCHYLAFDNDAPIAAAAMYVAGDAAWFGFAATDAGHRRRGGQRALVLRRLSDAAQAGCRWVSVETAEDTVTRDAPSFRNLRRLGFEVAYRRPNYVWTQARG
jgi:ribosomal protein S18 acetylase RimI-like enzyme